MTTVSNLHRMFRNHLNVLFTIDPSVGLKLVFFRYRDIELRNCIIIERTFVILRHSVRRVLSRLHLTYMRSRS